MSFTQVGNVRPTILGQIYSIFQNPENHSIVGLKLNNGECMMVKVLEVLNEGTMLKVLHPFIIMIGSGQLAVAPWLPLDQKAGEILFDIRTAGILCAFPISEDLRNSYRKMIGDVVIETAPASAIQLVK